MPKPRKPPVDAKVPAVPNQLKASTGTKGSVLAESQPMLPTAKEIATTAEEEKIARKMMQYIIGPNSVSFYASSSSESDASTSVTEYDQGFMQAIRLVYKRIIAYCHKLFTPKSGDDIAKIAKIAEKLTGACICRLIKQVRKNDFRWTPEMWLKLSNKITEAIVIVLDSWNVVNAILGDQSPDCLTSNQIVQNFRFGFEFGYEAKVQEVAKRKREGRELESTDPVPAPDFPIVKREMAE